MVRLDPQIAAHLEWLGFVAPTGLVVSAPALVRAGAILDRNDVAGQRLLRGCVGEGEPVIDDFASFARGVLGWTFSPKGYAGMAGTPIPPELEVALPDYGETLRPDYAVLERDPREGAPRWQLAVRVIGQGQDFDQAERDGGQLEASAHGRMERLLRETGVPAGLVCNGRALRLISAPRGESSGWIEFRVSEMVQTAGRPIVAAMRMLLSQSSLLTLPRSRRLAGLLEDSRKFQNEVSTQLAEQVLHALYELLRGFQAAHDASDGELLREPLVEDPDEIYHALLTVILRLLFVLYAEEREMLPGDATYLRHYSLAGLYERLRGDAATHPDTMEQRYGAWAQLLVVFRMIHDGAHAGIATMPARRGVLFDPDRYRFLEGRSGLGSRQVHERIEPPLVPDGTVYRALEKLLVLGGERISYRALDVEQIGSVYETMMGFRLETATGRSVAIRAQSRHGAPTTIDLDALLEVEPAKRAKLLADRAERKLTPKVTAAVRDAATLEDLHAALLGVIDAAATPDLAPAGAMVLQPSQERRRSGSHYTPRALTEPIVRTALEPSLDRLRGTHRCTPLPGQILDLKVCDPAMGSGAFLVEACRQLADELVEAWGVHGGRPEIPHDEDERVFARRLVAQRCLYGVDRNPVAVDLAKMSLWLITLAREHALTFVDHALRLGDSLVGLARRQIESFDWSSSAPGFEAIRIGDAVAKAARLRAEIRDAGEDVSDVALRDLWDAAQTALDQVRLYGDLAVAAFFAGPKPKERAAKRLEIASAIADGKTEEYRWLVDEMRDAGDPLVPFHWETELPEVFERDPPGFDAIIGNPPFLGGTMISGTLGTRYLEYISSGTPGTGGRCDLVAYFFRRAFGLCRTGGAYGLIGTKTIAQGDTRRGGLTAIVAAGGVIYSAHTSIKWPGTAAVTVSVVHVTTAPVPPASPRLNNIPCANINPFLLPSGSNAEPQAIDVDLEYFLGSKLYGQGFLFDDNDSGATPTAVMKSIASRTPGSRALIRPYIGGKEVNSSSALGRWAIDFAEMTEAEARRHPALWDIVAGRLPASRAHAPKQVQATPFWWYFNRRTEQYKRARELRRVLVRSAVSEHHVFRWHSPHVVFSHNVFILVDATAGAFSVLHSRIHEEWVRLTSSSLEDRQGYRPSDCLDTFAMPQHWRDSSVLELAGAAYHEFREALMSGDGLGLTDTYNRFHDPNLQDEPIQKLRELHREMDRGVLAAYGWDDIPTTCVFVLDHEIDIEDWRTKKKPYRYRWPDDVRDEVLARLIELNAERAAAGERAGAGLRKPARGATARPALAAQSEKMF